MNSQEIQSLIAGFVGALIGSSKESHKNIFSHIISVIAGTAAAHYLTPIIADSMHMANPKMMLGMSFLIGTLGLRAVEMVTSKLNLKKKEEIQDVDNS
jgi:uncharacterized membrane protein YeaQ/YmgE (transglycosylase-associated protein family)